MRKVRAVLVAGIATDGVHVVCKQFIEAGLLFMIRLTRLNKKEYYLNSDIIEAMEETPDTVITTVNGKKFVVLEKPTEIVERVIEFRGRILETQNDNQNKNENSNKN